MYSMKILKKGFKILRGDGIYAFITTSYSYIKDKIRVQSYKYGSNYTCSVCSNPVREFMPVGDKNRKNS